MMRMERIGFLAVGSLLLTFQLAHPINAGEVAGYEITIDREIDGQLVEYCFCTDLWGTDIESVTVTSPPPLNQGYPLVYTVEEAQWFFDNNGSEVEILAEFPDGTYTFDITFLDQTTATYEVDLQGPQPPDPVITSFDSQLLTWDAWQDPMFPLAIEVDIWASDESSVDGWLAPTATSFDIPPGFIQPGELYEVELGFVSSQFANGYKKTFLTVVPEPGALAMHLSCCLTLIWLARRRVG